MIFCSDSRTNADADRVSTYSKLHRFHCTSGHELVLLSAGNLATTQALIAQIERDIEEDTAFNLNSAECLSRVRAETRGCPVSANSSS